MCCDFLLSNKRKTDDDKEDNDKDVIADNEPKLTAVGRSMEWAKFDMQCQLNYNPANLSLNTCSDEVPKDNPDLPNPGFEYQNTYAYFFMTSGDGTDQYPAFAVDGINEEGLTCDTLAFKGCQFESVDTAAKDEFKETAIYIGKLGHWLLGMFDNVDDIKNCFGFGDVSSNKIDETDEKKDNINNTKVPPCVYIFTEEYNRPETAIAQFHFQLFDATEKGIILEWSQEYGFHIYDSIGIMANAPVYPWHIQNTKLYQHLNSTTSIDLGKIVSPFQNSAAMIGLPGDWTSASRFIRMYINQKFVKLPETFHELIGTTIHLLDSLTMTKGMCNVIDDNEKEMQEYTQWISTKVINDGDNTNRRGYHFRRYNDVKWVNYTFSEMKNYKETTVLLNKKQIYS